MGNSVGEPYLLVVGVEGIVRVPAQPPAHQCVEDGGPEQWHAEVEAKQPPVLHQLVELCRTKNSSRVICDSAVYLSIYIMCLCQYLCDNDGEIVYTKLYSSIPLSKMAKSVH